MKSKIITKNNFYNGINYLKFNFSHKLNSFMNPFYSCNKIPNIKYFSDKKTQDSTNIISSIDVKMSSSKQSESKIGSNSSILVDSSSKLNLNLNNLKNQKNSTDQEKNDKEKELNDEKQGIEIENIENLHPYSKDILQRLKIDKLNTVQMKIFNSINKNKDQIIGSEDDKQTTLILSDLYSGKNFAILFGIINRILNEKKLEMNNLITVPDFSKENFFVSVDKEYTNLQNNKTNNQNKKYLKPKGALVITQRFEFASQLYKICRKLDYKGVLKISRIGTTLQNISPVIEHLDDETEANDSEIEEICKINLLLNTQWKQNDILFISPIMMEFVLNNLDNFDKFDINPEMIVLDDFDYMTQMGKNKEQTKVIEKILHKYFSKNSDFYNEETNNRKLILSSVTFDQFSDIKEHHDFIKDFVMNKSNDSVYNSNKVTSNISSNSLSNYFLTEISKQVVSYLKKILKDPEYSISKINPIICNNFMSYKPFTNNYVSFHFENTEDGKIDKKLKRISSIINTTDLSKKYLVSVSSDKTLKLLVEDFKKKKINFSSIEKDLKINERLRSIIDFNNNSKNIMLCSQAFIKGLSFSNVNNLIIVDFPEDTRDLIKLLGKFKLNYEDSSQLNCKQ